MTTIVAYTDQQAIADGDLVALDAVDRVSRAVWDFLTSHITSRTVPHNWPMSNEQAAKYPYSLAKAKLLCVGLIDKYREAAKILHDNDSQWFAAIDHTNDQILGLRPGVGGLSNLWLTPNELGGMTLMFPSGY
jgi:hypothetical protein